MIDDRKLQDLIAIGRPTGHLTSQQLRQVLPIESMSVDELAEVVLRLERADIELDLDPTLLEPQSRPAGPLQTHVAPPLALLDEPRPAEEAPQALRSPGSPGGASPLPSRPHATGMGPAAPVAIAALLILAAAVGLWLVA